MDIKPIILLDLNYTLVANSDDPANRVPYPRRIDGQRYRSWLVDMLRPYRVFLITARPGKHREKTLESILRLENWQPERSYWNDYDLDPPQCKQKHLQESIFPEFGRTVAAKADDLIREAIQVSLFFAIESNSSTRAMYRRLGIPSARCEWIQAGTHSIPLYDSA